MTVSQGDRPSRRDIDAVKAARHCNSNRSALINQRIREARPFRSKQDRSLGRGLQPVQLFSCSSRRHRPDIKTRIFKPRNMIVAMARLQVRKPERRAGRNADRLPVERVAALLIEQYAARTKSRRIAKSRANIVMI